MSIAVTLSPYSIGVESRTDTPDSHRRPQSSPGPRRSEISTVFRVKQEQTTPTVSRRIDSRPVTAGSYGKKKIKLFYCLGVRTGVREAHYQSFRGQNTSFGKSAD